MFGSTTISLRALAPLCRRLAIALSSGIEVRTVWSREADRAQVGKYELTQISREVAKGGNLADAIDATGTYFPDLFRSLVRLAENTGHLPEVLKRLAEEYEEQIRLRRSFWQALWWPLFQLGSSIVVIGLLIYIIGVIAPAKTPGGPPPFDPLGFGLVGGHGLMVYSLVVGGAGLGVLLVVRAISRGALWVGPVQRLLFRIPVIGEALRTFVVARLAWTLQLTLGAGMDLKRALELSLRSTQTVVYSETAEPAWKVIRQGGELHEALAQTADYPVEFLDAVRVGEESGRLPEALGRIAELYREEAQSKAVLLTRLLGYLIWFLIGGLIVMMILRLGMSYVNILNNATKM